MQPDIGGQPPSPELIIKPLCWRVLNVFPSSSAHGTGLARGRLSSQRVWTSKGPWPREGQCDLADSGLTSGSDSAARVLLLAVFPGAPRKGPGRPRVPDAAGRESASTPRATQRQDAPTTLSLELALQPLGGRTTPGQWKSRGSPGAGGGQAPPTHTPAPGTRWAAGSAHGHPHPASAAPTRHAPEAASLPRPDAEAKAQRAATVQGRSARDGTAHASAPRGPLRPGGFRRPRLRGEPEATSRRPGHNPNAHRQRRR